MYNVWHATAGPDNANPYGDTVRLVMPAAMVGAAALGEAEGAAGCDDRSSRAETIFTWDPEVGAALQAGPLPRLNCRGRQLGRGQAAGRAHSCLRCGARWSSQSGHCHRPLW